ncbi:unnamed protein product, partial [Vitis vinifera]
MIEFYILDLPCSIFFHRAKSPFKNPICRTGLELLTNQVPIVVYCHSYKELKMANFALCTVHAKMPCKLRISHLVLFMRLWCEISSILPTPHEIFSFVFFDVNSFLILVISQSQALLCKDYKRGGNHLSKYNYCIFYT